MSEERQEGPETSDYIDYSFIQWIDLVDLSNKYPSEPIKCEVWQREESDKDEEGHLTPRYVAGQLTISTVTDGWRIKHPGLTDEDGIFVSAMNLDTSPGSRGVFIRKKIQPEIQKLSSG